MITKYEQYIKESLSTKTEIKKWLDKMDIENYTINNDLTVDVDGDVDISFRHLTEIPVKFNKVNGYFDCFYNNLTTLKGCPTIIDDYFKCSDNKLTNLENCPKIVKGNFFCDNNLLTSLEGCPTDINWSFVCSDNKLTSLKGCPNIINNSFDCTNNNLEDINDLDSKILIKNINNIEVSEEVFNKYFEYWIDKDSNIIEVLKDKVSNKIKQKYSHLFQANNFNLL